MYFLALNGTIVKYSGNQEKTSIIGENIISSDIIFFLFFIMLQGKEIYSKVEAQTDNLIKTISTYKVVGEKDAILESPKLNITLRKRLTIDMNDSE